MRVSVMEYITRNVSIGWKTSTSIIDILESSSLAPIVFQILYIYIHTYTYMYIYLYISRNVVTLKISVKITMYNIRNLIIR